MNQRTIDLALMSCNLASVCVAGDPAIPYTLAWIGYTGLLLVTVLFVSRFLASMEGRAADPLTSMAAPVAVTGG